MLDDQTDLQSTSESTDLHFNQPLVPAKTSAAKLSITNRGSPVPVGRAMGAQPPPPKPARLFTTGPQGAAPDTSYGISQHYPPPGTLTTGQSHFLPLILFCICLIVPSPTPPPPHPHHSTHSGRTFIPRICFIGFKKSFFFFGEKRWILHHIDITELRKGFKPNNV